MSVGNYTVNVWSHIFGALIMCTKDHYWYQFWPMKLVPKKLYVTMVYKIVDIGTNSCYTGFTLT